MLYLLVSPAKRFPVPADTFDNVKGKFPIGFFIWDCEKDEKFDNVLSDVYDSKGYYIGNKKIFSYNDEKYLNDWLRPSWKNISNEIGFLACNSNDFQNQNGIFIEIIKKNQTSTYFKPVAFSNLQESAIYFAVRHCIPATWLNDRDQFLYPNNGWESDIEFQNNCLAFTLFNNDIQSEHGTNLWIPFTEQEVNAQNKLFTAKNDQNSVFDIKQFVSAFSKIPTKRLKNMCASIILKLNQS